ncbi:MAG: phosphatidylglycerol lysyltransferase domain-containing protein [Acidimicrobiales bacterium]
MADDLVLPLPVGARVLIFANLHLSSTATTASSEAANEVARAIGYWSGPGAVVLAGGSFDFPAEQADVPGALDAHPGLRDALRDFAAAPGRRVVVLPGKRDAWLAHPGTGAAELRAHIGADVAPAVVAELLTAGGMRRARIEPGDEFHVPAAVPAGPTEAPEPGHQRLADVFPGLWRGSTSGWLAGLNQLDDPSAASRFVASRLVYRQLGRRAWLLAVPVLVALLLRLPVALLRPARNVSGILLATALGAALVESVLLIALAVVSLRQIWLAFSGRTGGPRDLNETARAAGRELVSAGWAGLVTGATCRAELSPVGSGFYANAGCCGDVVSEYPPHGAGLGLPSAFLATRQLAWMELETGNELHARLLYGQVLLPGATLAERLLTGVPVLPWPVVVASFPHGRSWPAVSGRVVPHRRSRRLAALVVAAAGFLSLVSDLSAPVAHHLNVLRQLLPLAVPQAAGALAALGGLALLMLARGIRRGQRRAYLVCQATLVAVAILHLLRAASVTGAIMALAVAGFLWLRRASFRAGSDVPPARRALARLVGLGVAAVVAGTLALEGTSWVTTTVHHRRSARIGWVQAFQATTERMIGVKHVALPDRLDDFFSPAMFSVTAGLVLVAAWMLFRPVVARWPRHGSNGGLERAREVVRRYGAGTLDYFTLRSDKQFFFWGGTVVAYAVYSGVCLVSPDPVGPPAEREGAWRSFREFADSRGWILGLLGASEDWLPIYRATGMHDLYVGDEAVVRTGRFSLGGGKSKGLRQAVKRVARHGYTISFHDPAHIDPRLAHELEEVMTKSRRGGVERGFSMTLGRIFDPHDIGLLLAVVHGPIGEDQVGPGPAVAFCQYVPAPAIEGFSLDLMRRDNGQHPNGLIDFAIVETVRYLGERGYKGLGLNFATMRAVLAGEAGDGLPQRVQAWLVRRMGGSMQIESLWRFNAKFDPDWQPRYAVYDSPEHALPTALAVARAESIWELPLIGRFLVPSAQRQVEAAGAGKAAS